MLPRFGWIAAGLALLIGGCRGSSAATKPPPLPVMTAVMKATPVFEFDEYLASLTSRHALTLYPQVSAYVRAIHGKPGEPVKAGALLVELDPGQQQGLLKSLQASVETRRANLSFATQNDESSQGLLKAGLLSELDYQQRHSQRLSADADLRAAQAQLQAQSDLLRFYRITAPSDGVLGDVPVKVGDYVTPQTRITTVDQDALIEAYLYIPVAKAGRISPKTSIQVLDDSGKVLCEATPSFVAPQVSAETQTVLVKTLCPNAGQLKAAEVLQGRVVWARHDGLTLPTAAAVRMAAQYFAYVVERGALGAVAHQRPIEVGNIQDNAFVVTKGLAVGDEVITTNVQRVREGLAVEARAP